MRALLEVQPTNTCMHEPSSLLQKAQTLAALESVHPGNTGGHEPSS